MPPLYGQVVAGPPGSGKTTFCTGMQEYMRLLGRNAWVINLDPANEVPNKTTKTTTESSQPSDNKNELPYETLLDVCDSVVNLSSVMQQLGLGPNGGLVYCMEYLQAHTDQVVAMIRERIQDSSHTHSDGNTQNPYLIFDLPGQVELYTHGTSVPNILQQLVQVLDLRLVAVQLIDSHYCTEPANFLSASLLGTTTMLRLELPTVSVLSKVDLLVNYGDLPMSLDFFTECQDLERLLPFLGGSGVQERDELDDPTRWEEDYTDDPDYQRARNVTRSSPFFRRHQTLHQRLAEVVDEFGLLSFLPLDISDAESVGRVLAKIDKCNGYIFVDQQNQESKVRDMFDVAMQVTPESTSYETIADIQERIDYAKEQKRKQGKSNTTKS
eukprot:Nitzschia sp. Nitz4//scaffold116_size91068//70845//71993//NITZ4_004965-RA/size91068-processed-gene-0.45-mRNA-1//1//CDS//3329533599//1888//frame0